MKLVTYCNGLWWHPLWSGCAEASSNAQSILNAYFEGEFYAEANTQFTELEPRSLMSTKTPIQKHVEVFPSPAKDFVNIQLHLAQWNNTTLMLVFASNGALVYEEKIIDSKQQLILPVTEYADGIYVVQIIQNEKQIDEIQFTIAK